MESGFLFYNKLNIIILIRCEGAFKLHSNVRLKVSNRNASWNSSSSNANTTTGRKVFTNFSLHKLGCCYTVYGFFRRSMYSGTSIVSGACDPRKMSKNLRGYRTGEIER